MHESNQAILARLKYFKPLLEPKIKFCTFIYARQYIVFNTFYINKSIELLITKTCSFDQKQSTCKDDNKGGL